MASRALCIVLLAAMGCPEIAHAEKRAKKKRQSDDKAEKAEKKREQAEASEDETISIVNLVEVTVRKSGALTLVRNDRKAAELTTEAAGAASQWVVSASVAVDSKREATIPNARAQVVEDNRVTGSARLAKELPTGGSLGVSFGNVSQSRRFAEAPDMPATASIASLSLDLRQPVLRGFFQGARIDVRKAELAADAATLTEREVAASTIRDLIEAYWELSFARANLNVRKQSLTVAQNQLDLTKKMHERGAVPESAVKAARYGVAVREEAMLRATDDAAAASLLLRRLAGLEIGIDVGELVPRDALVVVSDEPDVEDMISTVIARNPRIAAARQGIAIADVELASRKNGILPSVDIGASAGAVGVGADRGDAFSAMTTGKSYQVGASITASWEVGGAAKASAEMARIERTSAKVSAKEVERAVVASVIDAVRRLRASQARADVAQRAIELATANLETELALFRADKSSNVQVFERQTEVDEAQLLASRAAADCQIALATLDYLTGEMLDRYGVDVVPTKKR